MKVFGKTRLFLCPVGAFKTLDKDNSGNIELDIKEVKHFIDTNSQISISRKTL